jgi:hypothetical protein
MVMLIAKRQSLSSLWAFRLAVVLVGLLGHPGRAQDKETPYAVSLQVPNTVFQRQSAEVVIRVRNGQGEPLNGVPVVFEVEPTWNRHAVVFPQRTMTNHGTARVQFEAGLIGVVNVTARVGPITKRAAIVVILQNDTGQSW